jgi:leader peptidase (prepilin peptidase)/N-methyltransferase
MIAIILAFLAGLLIGSFLNVCIHRLPRDLSVVRPRSYCPHCEKMIAWYDNIPLVSYFALGGRCRHCRERISVRYPIVELATALAFAVCIAALGPTAAAFKYSIFAAILITLIASDLEERILPDEFTLGGTLVGLVLSAFVPLDPEFVSMLTPVSWGPRGHSIAESVFGALIGSGSIWLVGFLYEKIRHREGLGLGDVKMIAMIGAFLGLRMALLTLMLASMLGAVGGLIYIAITRKDSKTYELPFGSFLGLSALIVGFSGHVIVAWYSRLGS